MEQRSIGKVLTELRCEKEYQFLSKYTKNKIILDFGCGPGYGSAMLAEHAKKVIGIDIDSKPFNYAIKTYKKPNLAFKLVKSDSYPLEFEDEKFDVIISRHVIEHILDVRSYLNELKRILKKDGYVIFITPNRKSRLLPFQKPVHNDHVKEYTYKSFKKE